MALFNTPSLLDIIWRKETYPEESGIGSLFEGIGQGLQGASKFKVDKKAWEKTQQGKSTKNWGEVAPSSTPKPNAFKYFFGAGAEPRPSPAYQEKTGYGQQTTADPHSNIEALIDALVEALNRGANLPSTAMGVGGGSSFQPPPSQSLMLPK